MKTSTIDLNETPSLSESYDSYLFETLKDPIEAEEYLNAALEDKDPRVFLLALCDVAEAYGFGTLASVTGLNRENISRAQPKEGNLRISNLIGLLRDLGLRFSTTSIMNADQVTREWDLGNVKDPIKLLLDNIELTRAIYELVKQNPIKRSDLKSKRECQIALRLAILGYFVIDRYEKDVDDRVFVISTEKPSGNPLNL